MPIPKTFILTCAASLAMLLVPGLSAAAVVYEVTMDQPFEESSAPYHYYGYAATGTNPPLTGDFGADKRFEITFSAPVGMRFQIAAPPAGASRFGFFADLWSVGAVSNPVDTAGDSISFTGALGTPPTPLEHDFTTGSVQGEMRAVGLWSLTDSFAFESVTMTFDVPVGFNDTYANLIPTDVRLRAFAEYGSFPQSPPSRFMSLVQNPVPVPEPGTLALFGLGFASMVVLRRRKE